MIPGLRNGLLITGVWLTAGEERLLIYAFCLATACEIHDMSGALVGYYKIWVLEAVFKHYRFV